MAEYRQRYRFVLYIFILLTFVTLFFMYYQIHGINRNEQRARKILSSIDNDKDISYISLEQLQSLTKLTHLKNSTKAKIYHLMASVSYLSDDKTMYNEYTAYALYYYQKAGMTEEIAYIYTGYLGRLYENSGFDAAKQLLDDLTQIQPIDQLQNKITIVKYYLDYADVQEMRGEYASAQDMLDKAKESLKTIEEDKYYLVHLAKHDLLSVRLQLLQGNVKKADSILSNYNETDTMRLPSGNQMVFCDFTLPYYELRAKILLAQNDPKEACRYADLYLKSCADSNFYMMQYRMLVYLLEHTESLTKDQIAKYQKQFLTVSQSNLQHLSGEYCDALLNNIKQAPNILKIKDSQHKTKIIRRSVIVLFLYGAFILFMIGIFITLYLRTDAVTHLRVRASYEKKRNYLERRHIPYYLLVMDINHFHEINDMCGKQAGDRIMLQFGNILKASISDKDMAYRYGGVEFCVILRSASKEYAASVFQTICSQIQLCDWRDIVPDLEVPVSINGGAAKASDGKNSFRQADQALYRAKHNGKNTLEFYQD